MKRNEFLTTLTGSFSAVCLACMTSACSEDEMGAPKTATTPAGPATSSATINLETELKAVNNFIAKNGFIVIRTATGNTAASFVAFSSVCPHAGATVEYKESSSSFLCAAHGSTFSSSGALTQGPAAVGLTKFDVEITGLTLRVKA
jgi:cytochrome b6-f complex iron-sulfur subunit